MFSGESCRNCGMRPYLWHICECEVETGIDIGDVIDVSEDERIERGK